MDPECPLCRRLANRSQEDQPLWEFPHSVAWLGPWQYYRGYCLLISRSHARELGDLAISVRRAYLDEMCLLAEAIRQTVCPHKLNYELLGNLVPHLHWHLFPRFLDDPDQRKPVWIALERAETDMAEKQRLEATFSTPNTELATRLRTALSALGAPVWD